MQVDITSEKPWLQHYDKGVETNLNYPEISLSDLFERSVKRFSKKTALVNRNEKLSYLELSVFVDKLAGFLITEGLLPTNRVAIILPNSPQFVIAYFSILKAGGIVTAINPGYTHDEILGMIKSCGIRSVICTAKLLPVIQDISHKYKLRTIIATSHDKLGPDRHFESQPHTKKIRGQQWTWLEEIFNYSDTEKVLFPIVKSTQPAVFQFSGGTTGTPKAAIGTHHNLVANTIQFRNWLNDLREGHETVLAAIPLFHVYGMVIGMNLAMYLGAKLVLVSDARATQEIVSEIEKNKVSVFPGVPSLFYSINHFTGVEKYNLHSIKACISGSAPLPAEVKAGFEALTGGKVIEGYGLSEAPTATHCNPLNGVNKTGTIGMPLPDVDCRIADIENSEKILLPGERGELLIRGPQVMEGYYKNQAETRLALKGGWLHTGDIARMDDDGYFYIIGRKKDLIKVAGLQVWPSEIEDALNSHPSVSQSVTAGVPDQRHGEFPVAWVVVKQNTNASKDDLINWCKSRLAAYKVPRTIVFVTGFPRSGVGKILRRVLVDDYLKQKN